MTHRPAHGPTPEAMEQMCSFFDYFLKHGKAALPTSVGK